MRESFFKYVVLQENSCSDYDLIVQADYPNVKDLDDKELEALLTDYRSEIDNKFLYNLIFKYYSEYQDFLEYHYEQYKGNKFDFLRYLEIIINGLKKMDNDDLFGKGYVDELLEQTNGDIGYLLEVRVGAIQDWIGHKKDFIINEPLGNLEQVIWKGTPSQFGHLFLELAKQGYIEIPKRAKIDSYKKYAEICYKYFKIDGKRSTLIKEMNPNTNSLTYANKILFQIPPLKDFKD